MDVLGIWEIEIHGVGFFVVGERDGGNGAEQGDWRRGERRVEGWETRDGREDRLRYGGRRRRGGRGEEGGEKCGEKRGGGGWWNGDVDRGSTTRTESFGLAICGRVEAVVTQYFAALSTSISLSLIHI